MSEQRNAPGEHTGGAATGNVGGAVRRDRTTETQDQVRRRVHGEVKRVNELRRAQHQERDAQEHAAWCRCPHCPYREEGA